MSAIISLLWSWAKSKMGIHTDTLGTGEDGDV